MHHKLFANAVILPRMKICGNRMNEAALKVERIGEAVSSIRLRLRRVQQDCSAPLSGDYWGSYCSAIFAQRRRGAEVSEVIKGLFREAVHAARDGRLHHFASKIE